MNRATQPPQPANLSVDVSTAPSPEGGDPLEPVLLPDGLQLRLRPRERLVELELAGELDLATAPRLEAAMRWLRARYDRTIVLDTRRLDFVDLHGYRTLRAAVGRTDDRDQHGPRTIYVVGDVLARFQDHLTKAIAAATAMATGQDGSEGSSPRSQIA